MDQRARSRITRRLMHPVLAAAVAACLLLSGVGPAQAARAAPASSTYTVIVTPRSVTLCPGETRQVAVRVSRQVTRMVRGEQVTGRPRDVPRATIRAESEAPHTASVAPGVAQSAALQFVGPAAGRAPHLGSWFTISGHNIGNAAITFETIASTSTSISHPTAAAIANVECKFRVTLSARWSWTVVDTSFSGYFIVPNVLLEPDSDGKFEVDAIAPNRAIKSGRCGGAATMAPSDAHFSGRVTPDGLMQATVTFTSAPNSGNEGCKGKSYTGSAQAQPLTFTANVSTGQRHFFFQLPHLMVDEGSGSHTGSTIVYLTVLQ